MTGPDHYREAERLLHVAEDTPRTATNGGIDAEGMYAMTAGVLSKAQVHATLALVAAHVDASLSLNTPAAWSSVLS